MPTKSGNTGPSWEPGWSYQDSAGEDGATIRAPYRDDVSNWHARVPAYGSSLPEEVGTGLPAAVRSSFRVKSRSVRNVEGDQVTVEVEFTSATRADQDPNDAERDPIPRYSLAVSLSEEPLLSHERYEAVPEEELEALRNILAGQVWKTEEGKERWEADVTSEEGLEALAKIKKGTSTYREPGLVWREQSRVPWDRRAEFYELDKVRRIDDPPGEPPTGGSRNYLYLGPVAADQDETGEWCDLRREWELSGVNGWDPELYEAQP